MAVNRDPILKRCRSLGLEPMYLGIMKNIGEQEFIYKMNEAKSEKQQSYTKLDAQQNLLMEKARFAKRTLLKKATFKILVQGQFVL